jgi:VIT1/CCC1 family predicted Fe2+/Mn2+ transporter
MLSPDEKKRILSNWSDERNSAQLYRTVAKAETNPKLAEIYLRLAATEEKHAQTWADKLSQAGDPVPDFQPSWRTRTLIWIAGRFGIQTILPSLTAAENSGFNTYRKQPDATGMDASERSHGRLLTLISKTTTGGLEGSQVAQLEGRHKTAGGNALRAAVLGANDGLVSNLSLVMGVAGAAMSARTILITGLAGLLAGAISMALGEWISVQSSRELYANQIQIEKEELEASPEEEMEELALIYQARGMDEASAREFAQGILSNEHGALEALVRDELGIDPEELGGSAWEAAITSFILFALGAILPVLPFVFLSGMAAVITSSILSALGLLAIGAAITLFTGKPVLLSGLRQVAFGLAAALVTFGIGRLIGVSLGG